ncbi:MAG: tyrosine-type recombinase/integrase [Candidatus Caenarcaniphilales bacterium]|nr:tyrosine-type recombinase/integrase [Candidatus Caenarcaniphilales bacterium]
MKLGQAIQHFIDHLQLDGDTRKAYELDLIAFQLSFEDEPELNQIDRFSIKNYLDNLKTKQGKRVSLTTQNRHYATLRRFFCWLVREEHLKDTPFVNIERRRPNKDAGEIPPGSIIRSLDPRQVDKLVENCDRLREKVLFLMMYTTGLRASEALTLKTDDLNFDSGVITVRQTKGNKPRRTYLSKSLKPLLKKYLANHNNKWLFPGVGELPLSYGRARQLFNQATDGISNPDGSRVTLHQLRHTFATERAGYIDSILLMDLMGHADIRTTLRYAKVTGRAAQDAFERFENNFTNFKLTIA